MSIAKLVLATSVAALALGAIPAFAQNFATVAPRPEQGDVKVGSLTRYKVRDNVYMYSGPGGNTVVFAGVDGVVVIDPQGEPAVQEMIDDIKTLSPKPIRWAIDTGAEAEHVAGNEAVAAAGIPLEGGNTRPAGAAFSTSGAHIWAHEEVLNRLSAAGGDSGGWPTDTFFVDQKDMYVNGEPLQLLNVPAAHAAGDIFVIMRSTDVVVAGDVFTPDRYPKLDVEHGGSIQGLIDGLNRLLRITVPQFNEEGGTLVVPGHGRISDDADVSEYREMVTIIRDRVQNMIRKRATFAQIKAANLSVDYDAVYGAEDGARFVEAVYRSLTSPARKSQTGSR